MTAEAGSGLAVRAMLAEMRRQAGNTKWCADFNLHDTQLTVHWWPDGVTGYCKCDAVIRSVAP